MLSSSIQIVITYLVLVAVSVLFAESSKALLVWYLVIGVVTFFVYAKDKRAAINGNWRVPEKTLHTFSVAGGWLGALIAQEKLRHKTQKQPFRSIYWLTVVINAAAFAWTLTPSGQSIFGRWLSEVIGYL
ncbi:DUF1294 domain-containing protein [Vibrio splendidus]